MQMHRIGIQQPMATALANSFPVTADLAAIYGIMPLGIPGIRQATATTKPGLAEFINSISFTVTGFMEWFSSL